MFDHIHDPLTPWSVEEDMASDVYSYGVVLWEMLTRTVPWDTWTEVDIGKSVCQGRFLQVPQPTGDLIVDEMAVIVANVFIEKYAQRPLITEIFAHLSALSSE